MWNRLTLFVVGAFLMLLICSCSEKNTIDSFQWGKSDFYEDFGWVKYIPDTLYKTLVFDFNQDAKLFMKDKLKLGIYKKDDQNRFVKIDTNELQLVVDGQLCKDNDFAVSSDVEKMKIGIIFKPKTESKVHYCYFKVSENANGGLERINDLPIEDVSSSDSALMEIRIRKNKVWNPLALFLVLLVLSFIIALIIWFLCLRSMLFPSFKVGSLLLYDPAPFSMRKGLKHSRKVVLTSKMRRQSLFNRIFTGKILYHIDPLWLEDIHLEPRDKRSIRIHPSKEYFVDSRILEVNKEYILECKSTRTKTVIKLY